MSALYPPSTRTIRLEGWSWLASVLIGLCSVTPGQNLTISGEPHHRTWHSPLSQLQILLLR